jgi:hypothetical protein
MRPTKARGRDVVLAAGTFLLITCIGLCQGLFAAIPMGRPAPPAPYTPFFWDTFITWAAVTVVIAGLAAYGMWRWQHARAR